MSTIPERFWAAHIGLAEICQGKNGPMSLDELKGAMEACLMLLILWAANNHQAVPQLKFLPTSPARALQANAYRLFIQTGKEVDDAAFDRAHEACMGIVDKF